jgi:hypothetical protein
VVMMIPSGGGSSSYLELGPSHASLSSINSPKNRLFYSDRTVWETKLHSTDTGDVLTSQFKRGAVRRCTLPGKASASEDLANSD